MSVNPKTVSIEELIAHRGRMKLIGHVLEFDTRMAITRSISSKNWPLASKNGISPLILVELIAQTAGICNGWKLIKEQGSKTAARGWLVGIKQASFFIPQIPLGVTIIAKAQNDFEFEGFREIKGEALIENRLAAKVTLQVVQA